MAPLLKTINLSKKYTDNKILDNWNFELSTGKIFGLLGPNGSGKTTFIKIVAGILQPTSGEVLIGGKKSGVLTKSIVSYLSDTNNLYGWMSVQDSLMYFKDFFMDFDMEKALKLLNEMELSPKSQISSLSKGMIEKLRLVLVLSRNAKLYLLDEPLEGIDPIARVKTINTILDNFHPECSFIISTHLVSDIERIFDDVAFIKKGNIVLNRSVEALRKEYGKSVENTYKEVLANV